MEILTVAFCVVDMLDTVGLVTLEEGVDDELVVAARLQLISAKLKTDKEANSNGHHFLILLACIYLLLSEHRYIE